MFHNSNVFGSCITHILYTGCAKIKKIIPVPKGLHPQHRLTLQLCFCAGKWRCRHADCAGGWGLRFGYRQGQITRLFWRVQTEPRTHWFSYFTTTGVTLLRGQAAKAWIWQVAFIKWLLQEWVDVHRYSLYTSSWGAQGYNITFTFTFTFTF